MWNRVQRFAEILTTHIQLWQWFGLGGVLTVGAVTAFIARATDWVAAYGPIGWWGAALAAMLVATLIGMGIARLALWLAYRSAVDKWKQSVDGVNPLSPQFQGLRLRISDIAHPITHKVENKRFLDCEIIGPANLLLTGNGVWQDSSFLDCNIVPLRNKVRITLANFIIMDAVHVINCKLWNCVLFMPPQVVPEFEKMGAAITILSPIEDPKTGLRLPSDTGSGTPP